MSRPLHLPNTIKKEGWVVWYHGPDEEPGPCDGWDDLLDLPKEKAEEKLEWWKSQDKNSIYSLAFLSLEMPED